MAVDWTAFAHKRINIRDRDVNPRGVHTQRLSHGEPTWFVRDRTVFVTTADHHHDDRVAMWCAAPPGVQEHLVAAEPDRFFRPPYVGHRGWLGVYLDVPVDWDEIADLVEDAYRTVAPKRLAALLDEE